MKNDETNLIHNHAKDLATLNEYKERRNTVTDTAEGGVRQHIAADTAFTTNEKSEFFYLVFDFVAVKPWRLVDSGHTRTHSTT